MKKCQACGWEGEPPEGACPMCGEASWEEKEEAPAVKVSVIESMIPAPVKSKKAK